MPQQLPLSESSPVTLDGSGNGTAKVGPINASETWHPQNVHVSVAGPITNEAACKVYVGDQPYQQNFRDGTLSGSTGDATGKVDADVIRSGQFVWAVWSGGDPGHQALVTVTGMKETG